MQNPGWKRKKLRRYNFTKRRRKKLEKPEKRQKQIKIQLVKKEKSLEQIQKEEELDEIAALEAEIAALEKQSSAENIPDPEPHRQIIVDDSPTESHPFKKLPKS